MIKPLAKCVLVLLGLTAAASAADAGIHKKMLGSGHNTTLVISNDDLEDILKIVKSLEDSGIIVKGASDVIKNDAKQESGGFLSMLLGTLAVSLLSNMLTGEGVKRAGEETVEPGCGFSSKSSSLKNF